METIKNGNLRIENIWNEKFSGQNRRFGTTGDKINGLGYMTIESIQSETKRGKKLKKKNWTVLHWLWDNINQSTIYVIRIPEVELKIG